MTFNFYDPNEEFENKESINNYIGLFLEYVFNPPTLKESLLQLFNSSGIKGNKADDYITDIISKSENKIKENFNEIKQKYPSLNFNDAVIISSYTCETEDEDFSPYKILNKNMVSENRKQGLNNISKYLFILLKTLRLLPRYYPDPKNKYLYRCINKKVNLMFDPEDATKIPYIRNMNKTFWAFTSTSPKIKTSFQFLGKKQIIEIKENEKNEKKDLFFGTIFTLSGKIWGYDITLFNNYGEEEILLEPERRYFIENHLPELNEIINVICEIKDTPLVLEDIVKLDKRIKNFFLFKVLYAQTYGSDEKKCSKEALNKLIEIKNLFKGEYTISQIYEKNQEIFNIIKEMISNNEYEAYTFIKEIISFFNISEKTELVSDLALLFTSKKYEIEMDIKSIIYFFENLNIQRYNDRLMKILSNDYKRLSEMNLEDLKNNLRKLKDNGIYDYADRNKNLKFFTCLYDKKEAIEFLLSKTHEDIIGLYDRINQINTTITKEDIQNIEDCINIFDKIKFMKDNFSILSYIKMLTEKVISKFEMFSKNYSSIIELEQKKNKNQA